MQAKVIIDQLVAQGHELPNPLRNALIMHYANVGDIKQAQTVRVFYVKIPVHG
jgi:hypothetical protein